MEYVSKKARRSNQELSSLGKRIASMLDEAYGENTDIKAGGMPNAFRKFAVMHLEAMFTKVAKDLGVLPEQVFSQYGPQMFLSPADATRTADGKLQVTSDRAKGLFAKGTEQSHSMSVLSAFKAQLAKPSKDVSAKDLNTNVVQAKGGSRKSLRDYIRKVLSCIGEAVPEADKISTSEFERRVKHNTLGYIHISSRSVRELNGEVAQYPDEMKALVYLEDVLESGSFSGWKPNTKIAKKPNVVSYGVLSKLAKIDGKICRVEAVIEKFKNGEIFYYLRWKKLPAKVASPSFKQETQHSRLVHLAPSLENLTEGFDTDNTLSVSYTQGTIGAIGDWFPDVRAIATWAGANRSTFLHETGHMFLDMRTQIALDLKAKRDSGVELTKGEQHLLETTESALKWLGTDLESFSKMGIDEKRPIHEKFASLYEALYVEELCEWSLAA